MFKSKIKSKVSKLIKPIILKLGYVEEESYISRLLNNKHDQLYYLFNNLKKIGFYPKHIIDVGANHGTWTRVALNYYPDSFFTLVEPQLRLKSSIQDVLDSNSKVNFIACGAGDKSGSFLFTILDRDDSCTFLYTKEQAQIAGFEQIEVPVLTLNEIVNKNSHLPFPELVKIDAEGLDIKVLEGASELMGKTEVFLVEASVFCKSLPNNLLNVLEYMDKKGYTLFEITDLNRPFTPQLLWLVELAFVKKGGIIDSYKIDLGS